MLPPANGSPRRRSSRSCVGSDAKLWEELAPRWERGRELLWESTRAVGEWLVERLDPQPGQTILDVAAGTGETGFLAAQRGANLISSDLSPNMVEAAQRLAPSFGVSNAEFRVLDAERIDMPDANVDGVLSRFGYVLRGDPPPALREIRRVLRPGGRFAFAVWAERERNPWMTVPAAVMVERGHLSVASAEQKRLSEKRNAETIRRLLAEAGFGEASIEEMPLEYRFADAKELWTFVSELRGPVALALAKLGEKERADVRAEIERRAVRRGEGFELGGVSVNVVAS
jgi:ubiquinone/menaquinone biosynthesis C-methylase UbiE